MAEPVDEEKLEEQTGDLSLEERVERLEKRSLQMRNWMAECYQLMYLMIYKPQDRDAMKEKLREHARRYAHWFNCFYDVDDMEEWWKDHTRGETISSTKL